jgi:serine protease Do
MMRRILILAALVLLVPLASADKVKPDRGYLGVSLQFTESIEQDGRSADASVGVFVTKAIEGGPADLAGLRADDRIVSVGNHEIETMDDLKRAMNGKRKGDNVSVTVERGDRERTLDVVLGEMPYSYRKVERVGAVLNRSRNRAFVGIESQPVESQLAEYFGVDAGILITRVLDGTPADQAGLEAGDVIVAWEGQPVRQPNDIHERLAESKPGEEIELSVSRRGIESRTFVTLDTMESFVKVLKSKEKKQRIKVKIRETKRGGE